MGCMCMHMVPSPGATARRGHHMHGVICSLAPTSLWAAAEGGHSVCLGLFFGGLWLGGELMTGGCCRTVSECDSLGHEGLTDGV